MKNVFLLIIFTIIVQTLSAQTKSHNESIVVMLNGEKHSGVIIDNYLDSTLVHIGMIQDGKFIEIYRDSIVRISDSKGNSLYTKQQSFGDTTETKAIDSITTRKNDNVFSNKAIRDSVMTLQKQRVSQTFKKVQATFSDSARVERILDSTRVIQDSFIKVKYRTALLLKLAGIDVFKYDWSDEEINEQITSFGKLHRNSRIQTYIGAGLTLPGAAVSVGLSIAGAEAGAILIAIAGTGIGVGLVIASIKSKRRYNVALNKIGDHFRKNELL